MKVHEISIMVHEPMRRKARKKKLKLWKTFAMVFAVAAVGAWAGNYDPPKPVRPPLRYQVQPGDTLWDVATIYGPKNVDIREKYWQIAEDNDVQDGNIQPGQVLLIQR